MKIVLRFSFCIEGWEEKEQLIRGFYEELSKQQSKIESIYDFAAFNYMFLLEKIRQQDIFLGIYIMENERAKLKNPNLGRLREFSQAMQDKLSYHVENGILFCAGLSELKQMVEDLENSLQQYGEEIFNQATIPYFILCTLDRYIGDRYRQGKWKNSKQEPLNQNFQDGVYVYLDVEGNFTDSEWRIENNTIESECSKTIQKACVRDNIENLIFIEHDELPGKVGIPKVVSLWMSGDKQKEWIERKKLKIAVVPFSNETSGLEVLYDYGACFHIEYTDDYKIWGKKRAVALLELAVQKQANIVIFPEFVCCREIQEAIQNRLTEMFRSNFCGISSLLFVCAGSGWTSDSNNVAVLYSYDGHFLGKQYKYSKYHNFKDKQNAQFENLQDPGKETTILQINGLGKVMTGICRDIVDREYIRQLIGIFSPQMLITPAWSNSINKGFLGQFKEFASISQRTCSVLCNCCAALSGKRKFRTDIGIFITLQQKESLLEGKEDKIRRCEKSCICNCRTGGCLFLAEISFVEEAVKLGKMMRKLEQIFLNKEIEL